jgi:zinc transport system permease protein
MALGVIFLALKKGYAADAFTYLFGSILAVTSQDLVVTGAVAAATLLTVPLWSSWAYATFDRNLARTDHVPVLRHDYILNVAIAVVIVISMKVVGMLLIAAFLVLPAATARLLTGTFRAMTLASVLLGTTTAFAGLYGSYFADLPSGPCIVLLQAVLFFGAVLFRRVRSAG